MEIDHRIEHRILMALLRIVARARADDAFAQSDEEGEAWFDEAVREGVRSTEGSSGDVGHVKKEFSSTLKRLILKPLLDADLLELLRLILQHSPDLKAVKELIAKLTNIHFPNDKRIAIVKILSRAFQRGNEGAELVLTKILSALESRAELRHIKRSVMDAVLEASTYTAQYYKIVQPSFNPQPRPRYMPKSKGNDKDEDK